MPLDPRNFVVSRAAAEHAVREEEHLRRSLLLEKPLDPIDESVDVMDADERDEWIRYLTTGEARR